MSDTSPDTGATEPELLPRYAPALDYHLRKIFSSSPAVLAQLRELFNYCCAAGGREESCIPREADESFNPRLARLAQLLISEVHEQSDQLLGAVFLLTIISSSWDLAPASNQMRALAESADLLLKGNDHQPDLLPLAATITVVLDQIRHLHQSRRTTEERDRLLKLAHRLRDIPAEYGRYQRLKEMLAHAISQQERRCIK